MAHRNKKWLSQTGLNLIRVVIGSYFMAVSLGYITGIHQSALFSPFVDLPTAELLGSAVLFALSLGFITGIFLRLMSLALALFIICSSLFHNFFLLTQINISDFWRDAVLTCAVLLNYSTLGRREMRLAAMIRRKYKVRRAFSGEVVKPRRIATETGVIARSNAAPEVKQPILKEAQIIPLPKPVKNAEESEKTLPDQETPAGPRKPVRARKTARPKKQRSQKPFRPYLKRFG